ncbi:hypothetical protein ACPOL_0228 [Acidisarcina polymorpha]|uniref:Uncharacterized protein n=1 Tax=Acidisarcina polymorpha TaxID=2211140 RepID=A0A2Z5FS78_9BACT|nr:hypothetical protein ACPOL_0228 [Acidisarcina polymorpha]
MRRRPSSRSAAKLKMFELDLIVFYIQKLCDSIGLHKRSVK